MFKWLPDAHRASDPSTFFEENYGMLPTGPGRTSRSACTLVVMVVPVAQCSRSYARKRGPAGVRAERKRGKQFGEEVVMN